MPVADEFQTCQGSTNCFPCLIANPSAISFTSHHFCSQPTVLVNKCPATFTVITPHTGAWLQSSIPAPWHAAPAAFAFQRDRHAGRWQRGRSRQLARVVSTSIEHCTVPPCQCQDLPAARDGVVVMQSSRRICLVSLR